MNVTLDSPWFLLALLVPIAYRGYRYLRKAKPATITFSALRNIRSAGKSWRITLRWLPEAVFDAAFVALVLALARPQSHLTTSQAENASEGIAIEMVMDRSGSMYNPMPFNGEETTRLEAVKKIFSLFVFGEPGNPKLHGRAGDLVGLVTFAKTAETNCPLTLGHDALKQSLNTIRLIPASDIQQVKQAMKDGVDLNAALVAASRYEIAYALAEAYDLKQEQQTIQALNNYLQLGENNFTAIGDALALGIARLKQADAEENSYKIKSKVLILLTDGENNHGRDVASVISYAKEANVKIHVITIGEAANSPTMPQLKKLAQETGGTCTHARQADELLKVYQDIDAMERSKLQEQTFVNSTEYFQPFLLVALALLFLYVILKNTLFHTLP